MSRDQRVLLSGDEPVEVEVTPAAFSDRIGALESLKAKRVIDKRSM